MEEDTEYIVVNEIFGPTFQGEGKSLGIPCFFVRLSGCNQHCVWCDTPYTWDWTGRNGVVYDPKLESHKRTAEDIINRLDAWRVTNLAGPVRSLVISGGEPMLQQKALRKLINKLKAKGWWIEMETAGTIAPLSDLYVDQFNVSLKLRNSGNPITMRHRTDAIQAFVKDSRANFKFVVSEISDLEEIDNLVTTFRISRDRVYIMPEGKSVEAVHSHAQLVAQETLQRGYTLTTRLQVMLYGNKRGF